MPKLTIDLYIDDIPSYLRARRAIGRIENHARKYVKKHFSGRPEWVVRSDDEDAATIRYSKHQLPPGVSFSDFTFKWMTTDKLRLCDIGMVVGFKGDNDMNYLAVKKNSRIMPYTFSGTTHDKLWLRLKSRIDEYLEYSNSPLV